MESFLNTLKWNDDGLVAVIVQVILYHNVQERIDAAHHRALCVLQHVDTGEVLMQAFADRTAICETLQTRCGCCSVMLSAQAPEVRPI